LVPVMTELVPHAAQAASGLAKFAGWFAENPLAGIGTIVAAGVAKDVASAGISAALSAGVTAVSNSALSYAASLSAAQLATMKMAGSTAFAAAAIYAATAANDQLKGQTGGLGILDLTWGALSEGKGFFQQADENLNRQAKADAARRSLEAPGAVALNAGGTPAPQVAPGGSAASQHAAQQFAQVSPILQAELGKAVAPLVAASKGLESAAGKLGGGKGVPEAARNAPIISASR
jgi:hypothetical protein